MSWIKFTLLVAIALGLFGCASLRKSSLPEQIPNAIRQGCETYTQLRPEIVNARKYAVDHWSEIPPQAQELLKRIDSYLPQLDKIGLDICAASEALKLLELNQNTSTRSALLKSLRNINWDDALSLVMKAANDYVMLKQAGVVH